MVCWFGVAGYVVHNEGTHEGGAGFGWEKHGQPQRNPGRVEAGDRGGMKGSFRRDVWDPNFGSDSSRFTIFWGSQMVETSKQTRVKSFRAFHLGLNE